jgi:hypothetical protein
MPQHRIDDRRVDVVLPKPRRREERMPLGIVGGHILIEVVEEPGERPPGLVLPEAAGEPAHDPLDGDQVADGDVLGGLVADERPRGLDVHGHSPITLTRTRLRRCPSNSA